MITCISIVVTLERHIQVKLLDSIIYTSSTSENIEKLFFKIFVSFRSIKSSVALILPAHGIMRNYTFPMCIIKKTVFKFLNNEKKKKVANWKKCK